MPRLLVLNHHGISVRELVEGIVEVGATVEVVEPEMVDNGSARDFDGVVATGGYLQGPTHRVILDRYAELLRELSVPFLGVCLGLKILGYCNGARMRRIAPAVGVYPIRFVRDYPLAPGVRDCNVYQGHRYELIPPLPDTMENFATNGSPVQAVKVKHLEQYGLQFHPELSEPPAASILQNFVSLCGGRR